MNKIRQLNSDLIDQIAAGEVIDRPASVLKELIENSLDANANSIEIHISRGGYDLIQVSDNGCGINEKDLRLAFQRHATSKIEILDDLNNIKTLGFRGEALPSIASVSRISTRSSLDGQTSSEIIIHGGQIKSFESIASLKGSTFKVQNLFYNTPARRKFLKKPATEQRNINKIMRRFMLSRPDVAFKLISNNKTVYDVNVQDLTKRIASIYGSTFEKNILPVKMNNDLYNISGFVGNLSIIKKRQSEQFIFLNGRYIQNRLLNSAVYSAYQSLLKRGEYPFFTLLIEMPMSSFDVNVHPAKLEVRFMNKWQVYNFIKSSITLVLQDILKVIPDYKPYEFKPSFNLNNTSLFPFARNSYSEIDINEKAPHNEKHIDENINIINDNGSKLDGTHIRNGLKTIDPPDHISSLESITENIWQIHNKYLITEIKSGLIIIDQHVAHERILFEEAKKAIEGNGFTSQTILFPQTVKLLPEEYEILIEITHYLNKIGFRFREFGKNTIIIEGIPPDINWGNENQIIHEIIDQYISVKKIDPTFIDQIAAVYACKSAIKAGDPLKHTERKNLIDRLFMTDHPYYCPHGRPIIINLSLNELDKRFERH